MFGILKKGREAHTVTLPAYETTFEVKPRQSLLAAALEAGLNWPKRCQVGSCGSCKCKLLDGKIKAQLDFGYVLKPEQLEAGYILACQTTLKSDISVDVKLKEQKHG